MPPTPPPAITTSQRSAAPLSISTSPPRHLTPRLTTSRAWPDAGGVPRAPSLASASGRGRSGAMLLGHVRLELDALLFAAVRRRRQLDHGVERHRQVRRLGGRALEEVAGERAQHGAM